MVTDSTFYLVVLLLGLALMFSGIFTKIGLLNIASLPVWFYLAIEWSSEPLLLFTMVALAFFQVIYVFKTIDREGV